jgi:hypothetical protein
LENRKRIKPGEKKLRQEDYFRKDLRKLGW